MKAPITDRRAILNRNFHLKHKAKVDDCQLIILSNKKIKNLPERVIHELLVTIVIEQSQKNQNFVPKENQLQ